MLQTIAGFAVIALLAWNAARPYSIARAIFPGLADVASASLLLLLAAVVVVLALLPRNSQSTEKDHAMVD